MTTDRFRETAIRHARILEDQKRIKTQVADLILQCYDLPTKRNASPSEPVPADAKAFGVALSLFQVADFDELVSERNIDDRCGYALCPNPNEKVQYGGNKVWNGKGGKDFKLLDRTEVEKWCSKACKTRGEFVKGQLSSEPAWLRDVTETKVRLLDDVQHANDLAAAIKDLSIDESAKEDLDSRLKELSLGCGESGSLGLRSLDVVEREVSEVANPPQPSDHDSIEGHPVRKVRFGDA